jgi:hypothetical protein
MLAESVDLIARTYSTYHIVLIKLSGKV